MPIRLPPQENPAGCSDGASFGARSGNADILQGLLGRPDMMPGVSRAERTIVAGRAAIDIEFSRGRICGLSDLFRPWPRIMAGPDPYAGWFHTVRTLLPKLLQRTGTAASRETARRFPPEGIPAGAGSTDPLSKRCAFKAGESRNSFGVRGWQTGINRLECAHAANSTKANSDMRSPTP